MSTHLVDYAKRELKVTCKPNEPVAVTVEQVAAFADLVRRGCAQDVVRLIHKVIQDIPGGTLANDALISLGDAIADNIDSWGLPDCDCDLVDCVYCGPRIARRFSRTIAGPASPADRG